MEKEKSITFRVSEEDFNNLKFVSNMVGMSVSQYIRSLAYSSISAVKVLKSQGMVTNEDIKAVFNDKL